MVNKIKISFLGNFCKEKGSEIFKEVVLKLDNKNFEYYIFGYIGDKKNFDEIYNKIKLHRSYAYGELPTLIKKFKINLGICPSLFPETFHKVFFESINLIDIIVPYYTYPAWIYPDYKFIINFRNIEEFLKNIIKKINKKEYLFKKYNQWYINYLENKIKKNNLFLI